MFSYCARHLLPAGKEADTTMERKTANEPTARAPTIEEETLAHVHAIYSNESSGLISIGRNVGVSLLPPRDKVTVLLIGNHSAGKSSFINWYIDEPIQKTGVAMETSGFTFVTSGKKRDTLTGKATLQLFPHFKELAECAGVIDCITTEVSLSKSRKFPMVTFVDTPGLVDGEMQYPFDVDNSILWLGAPLSQIHWLSYVLAHVLYPLFPFPYTG
eukprot:m.680595 g.680595  ORF g.680595 m.680595 type:complete len:215 (-) comp58595_c0_seq1:1547-2191(-)